MFKVNRRQNGRSHACWHWTCDISRRLHGDCKVDQDATNAQ